MQLEQSVPSFAGVETSSELPEQGYLGTATWVRATWAGLPGQRCLGRVTWVGLPRLGYLSRAGELVAAETPTHPTLDVGQGGQSEGSPIRLEKGCDGIHFSKMGTKT